MFIVIKSEHYDCTNLICKKDTLEEAVAAVKDSMAQRINKNYHAGLTGTDITHENEDHYGFSFTFDENRHADSSEPRAYSTYDYWNGDDQESVEWVVYEVTTDKPFFLLSYEEYESIELTGFYDSFDEAFEEMKELIAESVNDVFDEDATADDVEDMEDYNAATFYCLKSPRRKIGDIIDSAYYLNETKRTLAKTGEYAILPIYIYEHSGIALCTVPFSDIWDSACIGFAVANINDFMKQRISDTPVSHCEAMHRAEDCIRNELEAYSDYLAGNCWQYCITNEDGNVVDSCSGFIDDDLEKNGILNYICDYIEK